MSFELIHGDCLEALKAMEAQSVHCCVTSPPYFGLRDYGHADQIGLEPTPDEFVAALVAVFREVRRVLRDDGTVWLNLGDSYAGSGKGGHTGVNAMRLTGKIVGYSYPRVSIPDGLKPKDLIGIPWRVAFALQADGWFLRQDIIWAKPNPMPESVTDRCTKAHEYIFLLSKSAKYFYDADAIREPLSAATLEREQYGRPRNSHKGFDAGIYHSNENMASHFGSQDSNPNGRNKRSVWTVATTPFSGAHFATFPQKLIEPCILAGCPKSGVVLDPFTGSGTTGIVALRHGRDFVGCELNSEYHTMARERLEAATGIFSPRESHEYGGLFAEAF